MMRFHIILVLVLLWPLAGRPWRPRERRLSDNSSNDTVCVTTATEYVALPSRQAIEFDAIAILSGMGAGVVSMLAVFGVHKMLLCLRARGDGDVFRGIQALRGKKVPSKQTIRETKSPAG
mmetsp:Transcript_25723/g.56316  ORF Transcript_25723/g.56316 Transcript_25723/m.56316 type:complete len:120 (+) Transcript_25723:38-397(+)